MDRLEEMQNDILRLTRQLADLQREVAETPAPTTPPRTSKRGAVLNFLRNGDLSYSENHYNDAAPPSGADDEKEAAHFYAHVASRTNTDYSVTNASPNVSSATAAFTADDVGNYFELSGGSTVPAGTTVLTYTDATHIVLSNNVTTTGTGRTGTIKRSKLVEDSAHAVSSTGHTVNNPTGTADPQWNRVDGCLQWGSNKSIDCPLPKKMAQPSKSMYIAFVARLRAGKVVPAGLKVAAGFHDNTSGQRKYVEGGQFTLSGSVVGTPGATTSRKYKIVATTDWGETYESNELTIAAAPSDPSYITNSVYVRLDWQAIRGVTIYRIYRLTGATYVLSGEIFDGKTGFNEQNNYLKTEAGYPVTSGSNARGYVEIPFDNLTESWGEYQFNVVVPQTYDTSVTTDKQWLRLTLSAVLAAGNEQGIEIDKLYVAWSWGDWAPAPEDTAAKQDVDTSAASSSQGDTPPDDDPPDPGDGGRCVWEFAPVMVVNGQGLPVEIDARDVTTRHRLVSFNERGQLVAAEIEEILEGVTSMLCFLATENGALLPCSPDHPVMQDLAVDRGRPAVLLRKGDEVLTFRAGDSRTQKSPLYAWTHLTGSFRVRIFCLRGTHLFVAGRVVSHNIKRDNFD